MGRSLLLFPLCLAVAAQTPPGKAAPRLGDRAAEPESHGPTPRKIKGLRRPEVSTDQATVLAALKDLRAGMVVVVDEAALPPLPWRPVRAGYFRLFGPRPTWTTSLPTAPWMDDSRIVSGGNPIALYYPLGWSD